MTGREAKRLALRRILASVDECGIDVWSRHPETGSELGQDEQRAVARAGEQVLEVMRRRADRLRSLRFERT